MADLNLNVLDNTTIAEDIFPDYQGFGAVYFGQPYFAGVNNIVTLGIMADLNPNVSDSIAASENVVVPNPGDIAVSDSITTSENTVLLASSYSVVVSDAPITSEAITAFEPFDNIKASDSIATSENVPTLAISYAVDVELANAAYFINGVKIV